ncbi:MAG: asparagine synthetase B, partial [Clostridiales bacterium]|nr:asparagine synthetase B [Clostridiales bacterium]
MSGFVGFVEEKNENTERIVREMADRIIHRGPDEDDYFVGDSVALGFRRLSTIDLDTGGQPIYNEDKTKVLVCNGVLYNYKELRDDLLT